MVIKILLPYDNMIPPAIVPIFVNTGVALLPMIVGALAGVAAVIFNPRELLRLCRRRPVVSMVVILGALVIWFCVPPLIAALRADKSFRRSGPNEIDWAKVALEILRSDQRVAVAASAFDSPSDTDPGQVMARIYRGSMSRDGYSGGDSPRGLVPVWEYEQDDTMYPSSPIVVGGAVYGASCLLDPPDTYGAIFCLDARTGAERWYTDVKDPDSDEEFRGFFSSPAVSADGRYLVIGQGMHFDEDCELVCLDAATGEVHWLIKTTLHIEGSPAIEGDIVVAGAGAIEVGDDQKAKGDPGFVMGVRLSDGEELWRYPLNDPESSPAVDNGVSYIGSGVNGSAVVALRTESDAQLEEEGLDRLIWKTPTPHPATGAITLTENLVLIGCGNSNYIFIAENPEGFVLALDRKTGKLLWQVPVPDAVLGAIAVRGNTAICPVRNGEVVAIDLSRSGEIIWRQQVSGSSPVLAGPAFTDELVYAVSQDGYLVVLDASDGSQIERHYVNAPGNPGELGLSVSSPFVVGGRVYVGSETGGLRCFAGTKGK